VRTARRLGIRSVALVTGMDQPLGWAVGNAVEIRPAVEILQGEPGPADYRELLLCLGGWMLRLAGRATDWRKGAERLEVLLRDGQALQKFQQLIKAQGGDERVAVDPCRRLPAARYRRAARAGRAGYLCRLDARLVGRAAVALGAGRDRMEDRIDYGAGIWLRRKLGDRVAAGDEIATLFSDDPRRLRAGAAAFDLAWSLGATRPRVPRLIREVIQ